MDPGPGGVTRTDFAIDVAHAMARARLAGGRIRLSATLSLEGATIPGGVLTPGAVGEGYIDSRHPHTYLHELVATAQQPLGRNAALSITAGKGFVPFGTDDPMSRPALRYPVDHHWAQVLERFVAIVGVRAGPAALEAALFNGDEPERPWQWPNLSRLGDSWAVRATVRPGPGLEFQASHAWVASPEHRAGAGPEAVKWSGSARLERRWDARRAYGLVEWARTEVAGGFFAFDALLLEGELRLARHRPYYRFERTERPEEERGIDPFRTRRPLTDDAILGVTRWTIHTLGYGRAFAVRGLVFEPLVEVARAGVTAVGPGLFRPSEFYGDDTIWFVTAGVRVGVGRPHRMGRYGVVEAEREEGPVRHGGH
jgi:hypothetical protein